MGKKTDEFTKNLTSLTARLRRVGGEHHRFHQVDGHHQRRHVEGREGHDGPP